MALFRSHFSHDLVHGPHAKAQAFHRHALVHAMNQSLATWSAALRYEAQTRYDFGAKKMAIRKPAPEWKNDRHARIMRLSEFTDDLHRFGIFGRSRRGAR